MEIKNYERILRTKHGFTVSYAKNKSALDGDNGGHIEGYVNKSAAERQSESAMETEHTRFSSGSRKDVGEPDELMETESQHTSSSSGSPKGDGERQPQGDSTTTTVTSCSSGSGYSHLGPDGDDNDDDTDDDTRKGRQTLGPGYGDDDQISEDDDGDSDGRIMVDDDSATK